MTISPSVRYLVRCLSPASHRVRVEATFSGVSREPLVVALPIWTPGSYLVREYARHVETLTASAGGAPLGLRKLRKNAWAIAHGGASTVTVEYELWAHDLTVRTNHADATHVYLNGAATFVRASEDPALRGVGAEVSFELEDPSWQVFTALPERAPGVFWADDDDTLIDSPIEVGTHRTRSFTAAGRPHDLALWGDAPDEGLARLVEDLPPILEQTVALFGEAPYARYRFILHVAPSGRGGLEHRHSCTVLCARDAFEQEERYHDLLSLLAHEHMHLWHVRRTRPAGLVPHDYEREQYTRLLWLFEGTTSYYDWLLLRRANRVTAKAYLAHLGERIAGLDETPGRRVQSLEDASFDAWIKLYRPDENTPNATVSYYLKGELVSMLLDLEIRVRSGGRASLDDVMRLLWTEYGRTDLPVPEDGIEAVFARATGVDLSDQIERWTRTTEELPIEETLRRAGLVLRERAVRGASLGVKIRTEGNRARVATVLRGGAGERAGLSPGDELVAIDGRRIDETTLRAELRRRREGDRAVITLARAETLATATVVLDARRSEHAEIALDPEAAEDARSIARGWLSMDAAPKTD